ncbi:tetratricopeptide repeat protein [Limibaculum sp. M0105]|uniref:Tetratricopeptide repeat protein n=1 Tax=Thermohalobaculum xanthum TaxID=2753746 RepID=A0A8J7M9M5_9RHOB|nr:tetratricopeptide repeat protein [Thermohalobaculum xanthum]MBK0400896.1 tetratricopeptide repeat protein [Thermohalobaculum xanthum]
MRISPVGRARLAAIGLALLAGIPARAEPPAYVGTESCAGCHAAETEAWRGSHHDLAWTLPGEPHLLGAFDDAVFVHRGQRTRFTRENGAPAIETQGADGALRRFPVAGVAGIAPLQQYLLETEPGRLQSFDVTWDAERGRWYHLYPDLDLPPGDGLHWTGPYKNWNARCAECHATGYEKAYDPATRRYASHEAEIGVGCEACHGPGEAHLAWSANPPGHDPSRWPGTDARGFTAPFPRADAEAEIQQCAGCHSRREPLSDASPLPGTPFHDAYRLALLTEGLYHADGTIQDEVYVYGSFLQSKMYGKGVRCSDCHDPHRAALRVDGNATCTQCHSPAGNDRFSSLRKALYDDPAHHFHEAGTPGALCVSCHMVERVYMGIDGRRDHSFRVPRPDLGAGTGAPDACTDCHEGRGQDWAAAEIARRFPQSDHRGRHFSEAFAAARADAASAAELLLDIATSETMPGIVRATALDLLARATDERIAADASPVLADPDPLVRTAAIAVQRGAAPGPRAERLAPLLSDPARVVRITAARDMLSLPADSLPLAATGALSGAMEEWRVSLFGRADFPETQMVLGGVGLTTQNWRGAEAAFREAVELDPQLVDAWVMIARIRAGLGDPGEARRVIDRALAANPDDPMLAEARRALAAPPAQ